MNQNNFTNLISYISLNIQPLSGIVIGGVILIATGILNWYGNIKKDIVRWIAKNIFRNNLGSEASADHLFMTITSLGLAVGGILIILAAQFLSN